MPRPLDRCGSDLEGYLTVIPQKVQEWQWHLYWDCALDRARVCIRRNYCHSFLFMNIPSLSLYFPLLLDCRLVLFAAIWGRVFVVHGGYLHLTSLGFWIHTRLRRDLQNKLRIHGSSKIHESCALVGGFLMKARIARKMFTCTRIHACNRRIEFLKVVSQRGTVAL